MPVSTSSSPTSPKRPTKGLPPTSPRVARNSPMSAATSPTFLLTPRSSMLRSAPSAASTAWSTMPVSAPSVRGDLLELKPENFDRALGVNLRGTVFLSQAGGKAMLAAPGDHPRSIITITSVSAEMASPERADYCISKAGLSMCGEESGAAARRRGHRRLRAAARHHPDRHDRRRRRQIRRADRRRPGAGKALGRGRRHRRRGGRARRRAGWLLPPARSSMSTARCRCRGCEG